MEKTQDCAKKEVVNVVALPEVAKPTVMELDGALGIARRMYLNYLDGVADGLGLERGKWDFDAPTMTFNRRPVLGLAGKPEEKK